VANSREAVRLRQIVPLLELEDSEWLQVVVSLISIATLIVLVVENPGPGLLQEQFAIQKLGREDLALILVPDEGAEKDRREFLNMVMVSCLGRSRTNGKPIAPALLNMLSTFGGLRRGLISPRWSSISIKSVNRTSQPSHRRYALLMWRWKASAALKKGVLTTVNICGRQYILQGCAF